MPLGQRLRTIERGEAGLSPEADRTSRVTIGHAEGMPLAFANIYSEPGYDYVIVKYQTSDGLVEAVYNHRKATIVILDNSITAMTGHQENPASGKNLSGQEAPKVDIEAICRAVGVERVKVINPLNLEETLSTLKEELAFDGISVIITRYPCIIADRSVWHQPLEVKTEICDSCGVCFKVACPGLEKDPDGDKTRINPLLCIGCQACLQTCKQGAIQIKEQ